MNRKSLFTFFVALAAIAVTVAAQAQSSISEDFTNSTTSNSWWFFNGACLTASTKTGSEPSGSSAGQIPGCTTIATSYYNKTAGEVLVGGQGLTNTTADPAGQGALRFTNGYPYGYRENGGIVFATPFPTGQGVSITFKTVTYLGNSGGAGGDGADGISFFLMDSSQLNTSTITGVSSGNGNGLGAWGGSLGYSCSNSNTPYNGLNGGYLGLGIDEYGNFLNGTTNTLGETGTSATGDNTASGGGYQPGRIGLRGAGNVSWNTLTGAYGSNPNNSAMPYYPASLATSCAISGGTYDSATGSCSTCPSGYAINGTFTTCNSSPPVCSSGTYNASSGLCEICSQGAYNSGDSDCAACTTGTFNAAGNTCEVCSSGTWSSTTNNCQACASGTYSSTFNTCGKCASGTYSTTLNVCGSCTAGGTYNTTTGTCSKGVLSHPALTNTAPIAPTTASPVQATTASPKTASPGTALIDALYAVQNTCASGTLWNYSTATAPTSAGATSLTNSANTGNASANIPPILDYTALPGGYVVLPAGTQIANEAATQRSKATPIYYQLKISQNGLLSLSYSICPPAGCGAFISVIKSQNITTANGPLPANFLFGFAGSTGGSSNIHEILCFKADPATSAQASAGASEKQSAKLETGVQAYFAYYNPSNGWTGRVTASSLGYDQYGNVTVAATPNWDSSCVLTGVASGSTCSTTNVPGPTAAEGPTSRKILTWSGTGGIPFEYNNLTTAQQNALTAGDVTTASCNATTPYAAADRVNYLRGDRSCEISTTGVGLFRRRSDVLSDIMDSSPIWVGSPDAPYVAVWSDRLNPSDPLPENAATVQSYPQFVTAQQNRQQVVYTGANDGLLHGFRSGTYNSTTGTFTNNDGYELLAYMPNSVMQTIHSTTNAAIDFSNAQYGHNFFVDATPGEGDLFFNGQWHSWLVGGLGPGGNAIYALDVTNPANFSEANAASLVAGEWTNSTITCTNTSAPNASNCGQNLGNTYGTPQIRRLHDGNWAMIFGNGFGSASGDAGIYVGVLNPNTGAVTFYYLSTSTGSATKPNGIAFTTPADLDGDHITDYVYAGDLLGNVWRFDLTSANESNWAVTPGPLFQTPAGQPITTAVVVASGSPNPGMQSQIMVMFGTGQRVPITNASAATYATGTQTLYGVWDWNMSGWNSISPSVQYAALTPAATGLTTANYTLMQSNLQAQTVTINATTQDRDIAQNATICWAGSSGCTGSSAQFGWYLNLPGTQEQVIYSPELVAQALTVNTIVPAPNTPSSCTILSDTGFTYVISAMTGGAFNEVFLPPSEATNPNVNNNQAYTDKNAVAMQTNATGSSFVTQNASGTQFLIYETNQIQGNGNNNIQGGTLGLNLPPNTTGHRVTWVEKR
jgi:type IV pilus assembly protein PilY1